MELLPLSHDLWMDLKCRSGDTSNLIECIEELSKSPGDSDTLQEIESLIGTESTTWPAAYAAVPYILSAAEKLPIKDISDHLVMIALSFTYSGSGSIEHRPEDCPEILFDRYHECLERCRNLLFKLTPTIKDPMEKQWHLAALVSLLNSPDLGDFITLLHCPSCGEPCFDEVQ